MTGHQREKFEAAVVERLKESGFLEVEVRTEALVRCDDGYQDEIINAGWHYWNAALRAAPAAPHVVIKRIADVASAVGWQAGEPGLEAAGHIVSVLAIHPEHVDRFLAEGSELFIDGTFKPENGSLTYRSIGGDILSPTVLRKAQGSAQ